jgi:hypothetical protein
MLLYRILTRCTTVILMQLCGRLFTELLSCIHPTVDSGTCDCVYVHRTTRV